LIAGARGGRIRSDERSRVKIVVLLGVAAIGYGIAYDGAGASQGVALAIGWAAGFVALFVFSRWSSYRAAFRVEAWRSRAEALRRDNPELYGQILAQAASDPEAGAAASRDPDAYVALWLEAADKMQA
jgi:hypothetical protein